VQRHHDSREQSKTAAPTRCRSGSRSRLGSRYAVANLAHCQARASKSPYRRAPTRLTPPFALPPALWRTAARATGRGLRATPARATHPAG
jgi:hypothetical protein